MTWTPLCQSAAIPSTRAALRPQKAVSPSDRRIPVAPLPYSHPVEIIKLLSRRKQAVHAFIGQRRRAEGDQQFQGPTCLY